MGERGEVTPEMLSPEYWDGHSRDDDCRWVENPIPDFDLKDRQLANNLTAPVLQRFLLSPQHYVLRRFIKGEMVRIEDLPDQTIFRFNEESLVVGEQGSKPYREVDFWAVIAQLPDGRKLAMRYFVDLATPWRFPGLPFESISMSPETTQHRRVKNGYQHPDMLFRDRDVSLYSSGRAVAERKRARANIPIFGTIFRRPAPNPI